MLQKLPTSMHQERDKQISADMYQELASMHQERDTYISADMYQELGLDATHKGLSEGKMAASCTHGHDSALVENGLMES